MPPLPSLGELWERQVARGRPRRPRPRSSQTSRRPRSSCRRTARALHRQIGEATGELIARYREQPDLCLSALPLTRRRSAPSA